MRHFNVMKLSEDYDPEGNHIRLWCPELENLPNHYTFCPWLMSKEEQENYKCVIDRDYPEPMVVLESWQKHYPSSTTSKNGKVTSYFKSDSKGKGTKKARKSL